MLLSSNAHRFGHPNGICRRAHIIKLCQIFKVARSNQNYIFAVCMIVHHRYNDINNQLDATVMVY